jgi:hypothetical protein
MSFPGAYTAVEYVDDCEQYKAINPEPFHRFQPVIPVFPRVIQETTRLCSGPLGGCPHREMNQWFEPVKNLCLMVLCIWFDHVLL